MLLVSLASEAMPVSPVRREEDFSRTSWFGPYLLHICRLPAVTLALGAAVDVHIPGSVVGAPLTARNDVHCMHHVAVTI